MARLNLDGTVDSGFNPNVQGVVDGIAIQADGMILIGGGIQNVGGQGINNLTRLYNTAASQSLSVPDTTRVQWLRNGGAPELNYVTFESSTDGGTTWTNLGMGTRTNGGWQLTGLLLPSSGSVRARGWVGCGQNNGSSGLMEQIATFSNAVPRVVINAVAQGGKLVLSWPSGTLQAATSLGGPYTNVPSALPPSYTNNSLTLPKVFYRVKVQ